MGVRVWDRPVRLLHGVLAGSALMACFTGHWQPDAFDAWHHSAGYVAGAAALFRICWGFLGPGYARFAQFVAGPRRVLAYTRSVLERREPRYLGHNPLGACMVLALLAVALALVLTGALYTTDWLWGYAWLSDLHAALAWLLCVLVGTHVAGVLHAGWRHRESLTTSMISGVKRAPTSDDVA
jgi:cytochrome b